MKTTSSDIKNFLQATRRDMEEELKETGEFSGRVERPRRKSKPVKVASSGNCKQ
jgi:hypothetical protein